MGEGGYIEKVIIYVLTYLNIYIQRDLYVTLITVMPDAFVFYSMGMKAFDRRLCIRGGNN